MTSGLYPALVADIGGTNARFAMIDEPGMKLRDVVHLRTGDYPGLYEAMGAYGEQTGNRPRAACVAVAGPVMGDHISFPNQDFAFSIAETQRKSGLPLDVINDCAAFAYSLPHLPQTELISLGGSGEAVPGRPKVVVCPGTGLGASGLVPCGGDWVAVPGETGHVDLPVVEELEVEVMRAVRKERGRTSIESILSGPGLLLLRNAIATVLDLDAPPIEIAELTRLGTAETGADPLCKQTLETFCALLGGVAGNMALTFGAIGGVYLGGGIPPRFPDFIKGSAFRRRFEAKGRMSDLLKRIPTLLITGHNVALRGAAVHLEALSRRG